jgi:hypothetical protein
MSSSIVLALTCFLPNHTLHPPGWPPCSTSGLCPAVPLPGSCPFQTVFGSLPHFPYALTLFVFSLRPILE